MGFSKSTFQIIKMDCPSEEQLIRMKLEGLAEIGQLIFNIPDRKLEIIHRGRADVIFEKLSSLNLDTTLIKTEEWKEAGETINSDQQDQKLLRSVLAINAFFFILEIGAGYYYSSLGLMSDGLDMFADCLVYGLALVAAGKQKRKKDLARLSGYIQLGLAMAGITEVIRRVFFESSFPDFTAMVVVSFLALVGNYWCLVLLQKSKSQEIHMKASMIFTSNDILVNIGVIVAATAVYLTNSRYPDLLIGSVVFLLVTRGAIRILKL